MNIDLKYSDFKATLQARSLTSHYWEINGRYTLFLFDGPISAKCSIDKDSTDGVDFETNLKSKSNLKIGSLDISGVADPKGMRARLVGIVNTTSTKNSTVNHDYLIPQLQWQGVNKTSYFDGIQYRTDKATCGDKMTFQVIDKDGAGVGLFYTQAQFDAMGNLAVIEEFGEDFAVMPNQSVDIKLYKAHLLDGFYIRIKYTSIGTLDDVTFIVNIYRHLDGNS